MGSKHKRTTPCGCITRIDGTERLCPAHQLIAHTRTLTQLYPLVWDELDRAKATVGKFGGGTGHALPFNATVFDLLTGFYDVELNDDEGRRVLTETHPGITYTILGVSGPRAFPGVEPLARRALGRPLHPNRYPRQGWDGLGADPRIPAALRWLAAQAHLLADQHETLLDLIREHLTRITSRCEALLYGSRFTPGWGLCPDCDTQSVVFPAGSLLTRRPDSVCLNRACPAASSSGPSCWRYDADTGEWVRVSQPREDWLGRPIIRLTWDQVDLFVAAIHTETAHRATGTLSHTARLDPVPHPA